VQLKRLKHAAVDTTLDKPNMFSTERNYNRPIDQSFISIDKRSFGSARSWRELRFFDDLEQVAGYFVVATNRDGQGAEVPGTLRLLLVILLVLPAGSPQTGEPTGRNSDSVHFPASV